MSGVYAMHELGQCRPLHELAAKVAAFVEEELVMLDLPREHTTCVLDMAKAEYQAFQIFDVYGHVASAELRREEMRSAE